MRKSTCLGSAATLLLALSWSQLSFAQAPGCGNIQFSSDITSRFPNARNACLDVVTRDGQQFAHFKARIANVRGNTVEAQFRQPDGTYGRTISITPAADARVRIQGRTYRYSELERGQELDVYLPPDRWAFAVHQDPSADFATAQAVQTVPIQEPSPTVAALPSTGGSLPLLAFLGIVLVAVGASVGVFAARRA